MATVIVRGKQFLNKMVNMKCKFMVVSGDFHSGNFFAKWYVFYVGCGDTRPMEGHLKFQRV